mgnify:CR=1 FL=1
MDRQFLVARNLQSIQPACLQTKGNGFALETEVQHRRHSTCKAWWPLHLTGEYGKRMREHIQNNIVQKRTKWTLPRAEQTRLTAHDLTQLQCPNEFSLELTKTRVAPARRVEQLPSAELKVAEAKKAANVTDSAEATAAAHRTDLPDSPVTNLLRALQVTAV